MRPARSLLLLLALAPLGCPTATGSPYGSSKKEPKQAPQVDADDPRVVMRDGELYTQKTIERVEEKTREQEKVPGLGSGRPDETNGQCRLYAPKLPDPECCKAELGFDVETVKKACGHSLYLGESFYHSCGYYFHSEEGPRWLRLSLIPETTPKEAAEHHDRKMSATVGEKYPPSTPVPGVPGAWWSRYAEYRWAFLPGWDNVRQLSFNADSCSDEGIIEVMKQIIAAKRAPEGSPRQGLVPKARM